MTKDGKIGFPAPGYLCALLGLRPQIHLESCSLEERRLANISFQYRWNQGHDGSDRVKFAATRVASYLSDRSAFKSSSRDCRNLSRRGRLFKNTSESDLIGWSGWALINPTRTIVHSWLVGQWRCYTYFKRCRYYRRGALLGPVVSQKIYTHKYISLPQNR